MRLKVKKIVKTVLIFIQGWLFPNTYAPFDLVFRILNLREV